MTKTVVTQSERHLLATLATVTAGKPIQDAVWDTRDSKVNHLTVRNLIGKGLIVGESYTYRPNVDPETESQRAQYTTFQGSRSKIRPAWRLRLTVNGAKVVLS
jgi:hypothetical protein